jgi:hypothetical protein
MPSKVKWTKILSELLGRNYVEIGQETLQAMHVIVFARHTIAPIISRVATSRVKTGLGDVIGNKVWLDSLPLAHILDMGMMDLLWYQINRVVLVLALTLVKRLFYLYHHTFMLIKIKSMNEMKTLSRLIPNLSFVLHLVCFFTHTLPIPCIVDLIVVVCI